MDQKHKPAYSRLYSQSRASIASILISLSVALAFFFILHNFTYLQFPKYIDKLKGDRGKVFDLEREFSVAPGTEGNVWELEIEFFNRAGRPSAFRVFINGTLVKTLKTGGKRIVLEFSTSLLREGKNVLKLSSDAGWSFRRLRIKNIHGYSSGFLSAVIFEKNNVYPDAQALPPTPLSFLFLALFSLSVFVLNIIPVVRTYPPQRFLQALRRIRYFVPGLFLAVVLFPLFSRYRAAIELASVGRFLAIFFALAYVFELKGILGRAARRVSSLAGIYDEAKTEERLRWEKGDLLPGILIFCFVFLCLVYPGPKKRSGDSLEYCAMLVSWAEYFRPYVTKESGARMEKRLDKTGSSDESPFFSWSKEKFPGLLKNGTEMDLPHFWFYSLGAAVFYWPVRLVSLDIRLCFMLLHIVLLFAAFLIISRKLGQTACLSLFFMIYASPLFWFINNVHVEFFTVMLALIGITLFVTEDFAAAAFSFAVASTQNPPFAILCVLIFLFGFWRKKGALVRGRSLLIWSASFLLACLHPAYYYFRLGILNPIVGTRSIGIGSDQFSLKKMLCFIVDPDIGLLVNWLLALPLLLVFAILTLKKQTHLTLRTGLFICVSVPVLLWGQSRTGNLNHGGTFSISRYALWYFYVFFLMAWQIGLYFSRRKIAVQRVFIWAVILLGFVGAVEFWPNRPETYLRPTWASRLLYDRLPGLYDPMPEIFIERYRGKERRLPDNVWAVSNASGNKILVERTRMRRYRKEKEIPPIMTCPQLDPVLVYREAKKRFARTPQKDYVYINGMGKKFIHGT